MASVFPDTSVNNPDTGFAWADGDIWSDPDSGLTYSWYNPVWKTGGAGNDNNFVLVAGDNMTGDLTLGTDKITLDATDGSAEFAGDVTTVGNTLYGSWGLLVDSAGASGQAVQVNQNGVVRATIDADGSATFCSSKILLEEDGRISCGNAAGSVQHSLQPSGDATFAGGNITFDSTGSAEFTGNSVSAGPGDVNNSRWYWDGCLGKIISRWLYLRCSSPSGTTPTCVTVILWNDG